VAEGDEDLVLPDEVLALMRENGVPITRANYIEAAWGPNPPAWEAAMESGLPKELQDWSLFEEMGGELVLKEPVKGPAYEAPQGGETPAVYDTLTIKE
jgi:hypothetical protein